MTIKLIRNLAAAACVLTCSSAFAVTIAPSSDSFGTLSGATFGGTGISNAAVAITTAHDDSNTIVLGLTATPRFPAPPVGFPLANDNAGTFYSDPGTVGTTPNLRANWNFDYYISLSEPSTSESYLFKLLITNNTTGASNLVSLGSASTGIFQDSENLIFGTYGGSIAYDANAHAIYGFELEAFKSDGTTLVAKSAINVNVGVPDSGSTLLLTGLGLLGVFAFGYHQKRLALSL